MMAHQPTPLRAADWELYRRLKAERRLNLRFRFSEPTLVSLPKAETLMARPNLLPFISSPSTSRGAPSERRPVG
jgi:hypothetical protein